MTEDPQISDAAEQRPPRRRRGWRALVWFALGGALLGILLLVPAFLLAGRSMTAPNWVLERIETRVSTMLPNAVIGFDTAELVLQDDWQPRVRLTDLVIDADDGREVLRFSEVAARVSVDSVLSGQVALRDLSLTGVFATLTRSADGRVAVSSQDVQQAPLREAPNFGVLVQEIDRIFDVPALRDLASARLDAVTLRYEDAVSGRAWTIDGGRAVVERNGDQVTARADLALLSGGQGVATLTANYESTLGETGATFGIQVEDVAAEDIAVQGRAFGWLTPLRATISGSMRGSVTQNGALGPLNATLSINEGVLQPNDVTRPIPFQSVQTYLTYLPDEQTLEFSEVSIASDWVSTSITGSATLAPDSTSLVGQFQLSGITFDPADLYGKDMTLEEAAADFSIAFSPFSLHLGALSIRDQGEVLTASGRIAAQEDGWSYALDAQTNRLEPSRLIALWPEGFAGKTRTWISENVLAGTLKDVDFALRGAPVVRPDMYFSFGYEDATVRYVRTLPPVERADGQATMYGNRMVLAVDAGHVAAPSGGQIDVAGSTFIVPDISVKGGAPAVVRLKLQGPVPAALSYLNLPPFSVLDRANLPEDLAQGVAVAEGSVRLPLRKGVPPEEIFWDAKATLRDVSSETLVKGYKIAAQQLSLEATEGQINIGGRGTLSGVPFNASWSQKLRSTEPGQVAGDVELSDRTAQAFSLGLPPGTLSGRGTGQIAITLPRGEAPQLSLTSDLAGVGVSIPQIGWRLPQSARGALDVRGQLGQTPRIDRIALSGAGLDASGRVRLRQGGGLDRATFDRVRVGSWLNAPVNLIGRGAGAPPAVEVRGGVIDLRTASFGASGSGGSGQEAGPLVIALDTLQVTDTIAMTGFAGEFDVTNGLDGSFVAKVNGGASVAGRVLPQNGRSAVRITSQDAGGVVAASGLLRQARGGDLDLTLLPIGGGGAFDGTLKVSNTRIKDAPVMADLLSALSVVGLLEQMSGNGILFSEVDASFRLTPGQVILRSASAVGPSLGFSMDGTYANANRTLNMQGVISPIYLLNGIGSIFTRKGEGLIGFNYRLRGPADKPQISVNPLSALTPGMFREIFRAPPPDLPELQPGRRSILPQEFADEQAEEEAARQEAVNPDLQPLSAQDR
ncbi:MAG: hypothetical protein HRU30_08905 [Rhodobacteraceae bacterium]|nr:hypothetical protein [Paracoccaceae bacterium]